MSDDNISKTNSTDNQNQTTEHPIDEHDDTKQVGRILGRREALTLLSSTGAAALIAGCAQAMMADSTVYLPVINSGEGNGSTPSTATPSATSTASPTASPTATSTATTWQSGSTELITVDYPDDAIFESGGTCTVSLIDDTTLGPCYFEDDTGEDISLGLTGLPMQLCLRLIDSECQPLANYTIEIWHCDTAGVYSGDTADSEDANGFAVGFCTSGDSAAQQSTWYRGKLTTDDNGRVNFKTCFPGWYPGRTIHIHFAVSDNGGSSRGIISQLCFTDELAREICTTHERYSSRGEQNAPLASGRDAVFPSTGYEAFLLTTEQNSDGTLLAYHTIQIA